MPKATPAALAAAKKELPQNWEARDVKGRIVYINHSTRTTQWDKPKISKNSAKGGKTPQYPVPVTTATNGKAANTVGSGRSEPAGESAAAARAMMVSGQTRSTPAARPGEHVGDDGAGAGGVGPDDVGASSRGVMVAPLPPGWQSKVINGKVVYIDHATKRTTFERPITQAGGPSQANRAGSSPASRSQRSQSLNDHARGDSSLLLRDKSSSVTALVQHRGHLGQASTSSRSGDHSADPIYASNASAKQPSVGDSPLPPGWGRSATPQGELYYVNHVTKTTTWTKPQWTPSDEVEDSAHKDELEQPAASLTSARSSRSTKNRSRRRDVLGNAVESAQPPLPPGWEERMSAEGKVFYINHHNKTTHWTRPDPPPVQPSNPPAEDLPIYGAAAAVHERLGRASPLADRSLSPLPADGSDGAGDSPVSSVSDLDAVPFGLGESFVKEARAAAAELEAQEGDGVVALKEELPKASTGAEFESVHVEEVDGSSAEAGVGGAAGGPQYGYFKRGFEGELSKGTAEGDGAVGAGLLEEVEGAPDSGTGVQLGDPKRAPSATVVAAAAVPGAAEEEESTFRSMGASPSNEAERSAAAAATAAGANTSARAAGSDAPDDGSAGGGGPGPVSSIVKSGLFGATVSRPNSPVRKGTGGSDSPMAARGTSSSAPIYASSAGNIAVAAAAAAAVEEESEPESEEAPLAEGWIELKTPEGKMYYQNSITKTTQWNRPGPPEPATPKVAVIDNSSPSPVAGGAAAEAGWEKVMTADGRPYYQNTITKNTSWQQPEGWGEPRAAGSNKSKSGAAAHGTFFQSTASSIVDVEALGVEVAAETPAGAVAPTPIGRAGGGAPVAATRRGGIPEEVQEAPLPPGWEKLLTDDGVPFWTNHNERTTSWDPPLPAAATPDVAAAAAGGVSESARGLPKESLPDSETFESVDGALETVAVGVPLVDGQVPQNLGADGRPLPEGWEMQATDQGVPYYVDHINKRTSWDPPLMSTGGMSVIASQLPDIPPAELVPDSADLYMGADLLNRFFGSWMGDAQGKSPLEAARNVIVTYLTGPGLKVTKGRNAPNVQRFLYLSPTNKQVVWATKATSKGKLSKKGLTLDSITELHSEESGIRVEARSESSPLILKSAAVETLTSEGATILLGVLLADMTGTMLRLQGVNSENGCCYYPASFVNEVLTVRQGRMEKNAALAAATTTPHQADPSSQQSPLGNSSNRVSTAAAAAEAPAAELAAAETEPASRSVTPAAGSSPVESNGKSHATPAADPSAAPTSASTEPTGRHAPDQSYSSSPKPASVASEWRAAERTATSGTAKGKGVAASYMAHLSKGSQRALKAITDTTTGTAFPVRSKGAAAAADQQDVVRAPSKGPEKSAAAACAAGTANPDTAVRGGDKGETDSTSLLEGAASPAKVEDGVVTGVARGSITPKDVAEGVSEPVVAAAAGAPQDVHVFPSQTFSDVVESTVEPAEREAEPEPEPEPAVVAAAAAVVVVEAAADGGEEGDDEETREYRRVLTEMLRPVKMEKYVPNFLSSGITLDILPLVERADLHSEVGIAGAVPQLKIMKAIKTRFPEGV